MIRAMFVGKINLAWNFNDLNVGLTSFEKTLCLYRQKD